jgi:hypothetical protein
MEGLTMQTEKSEPHENKAIREELQTLKNRINLIEATLDIREWRQYEANQDDSLRADEDFELNFTTQADDSIEFRIGEYGMAWLGNIVLLFGISFLVQYLQNAGLQAVSAFTGFISVALIYAGAYFTVKSLPYLSKLFAYNGHLLLFYMALKLHFFQADPIIKNNFSGHLIVLVVTGILIYLAYQHKSQLMAGMVLLMMLFTGMISQVPLFSAGITTLVALFSILLYNRFGWLKLVFVFIFLIYLGHLSWLLNSPLAGNTLEFNLSARNGAYLIFATSFIISLLAILPKNENVSDDFIISSIVLNGFIFSAVLALSVVIYFSNNYIPVFSILTIFCLAYSVMLQSRSDLKITASMYALYGFLAMSVTIYGILLFPKAFMLLSLQSLLVVSMALWFRSRFIVIMNTILFMVLIMIYLAIPERHNPTNFSFMLVALITARIINWKKERLNIKTELIRNIYLTFGFVMTLFAFYHAFPPDYITISWIVAALLFFLVGRLIHNIKYRWLAIGTLVASGIKLIFIDLSDIDIGFRVLVFLLLAVISITVSILYTKYLIKKKE